MLNQFGFEEVDGIEHPDQDNYLGSFEQDPNPAKEGSFEQYPVDTDGLAPVETEEPSEAAVQALAKVSEKEEKLKEAKRKKEKAAALAKFTNLNHSLAEARKEEATAARVHAEAAAKVTLLENSVESARLKLTALEDKCDRIALSLFFCRCLLFFNCLQQTN